MERGVRPFKIAVSAELDPAAHETLRLRAFFRQFGAPGDVPDSYYEYLADPTKQPFTAKTKPEWEAAGAEALELKLGRKRDNLRLVDAIKKRIPEREPWLLIGGPPCQAYSVVGRARNKGKDHYQPERDRRHFLYREYLHILDEFAPDAFIMENVRGILSSKVRGERIFGQILADLSDPGKALGKRSGARYTIFPLGADWSKEDGTDPLPDDFLLFSEEHGIPQARHRVILFGVRTDHGLQSVRGLTPRKPRVVKEAWAGLPALRSGLSDRKDTQAAWVKVVEEHRQTLLRWLKPRKELQDVRELLRKIDFRDDLTRGGLSTAFDSGTAAREGDMPKSLSAHLLDRRLRVTLNHETRGHMSSDLRRYLFCAAFARKNGRSPSSAEFPGRLAPDHESWDSGDFADRFRVHSPDGPSSTITSHIAKDGHYFIHHDLTQCRSMTVREAARLQTFPDNYFFLGNRTEQFTQVGNAVPPLLARAIAKVVFDALSP
jgi:DNA (cytosine-5)-methyltransferase 1